MKVFTPNGAGLGMRPCFDAMYTHKPKHPAGGKKHNGDYDSEGRVRHF